MNLKYFINNLVLFIFTTTRSHAINSMLTDAGKVDTKRHATKDESTKVLGAVLAERLLAQEMKHSFDAGKSFVVPVNHYTAIRIKLEHTGRINLEDAAKCNHYRVLELTCELGDILDSLMYADKDKVKESEKIAHELALKICSLTGMHLQDINNLVKKEVSLHKPVRLSEYMDLISNIIIGNTETEELRKAAHEAEERELNRKYNNIDNFQQKIHNTNGIEGPIDAVEALVLIDSLRHEYRCGPRDMIEGLKDSIKHKDILPKKVEWFVSLLKKERGNPAGIDHQQAKAFLTLLKIDDIKDRELTQRYENSFNAYYESVDGKELIQPTVAIYPFIEDVKTRNNGAGGVDVEWALRLLNENDSTSIDEIKHYIIKYLPEELNIFFRSVSFRDLVTQAVTKSNFDLLFETEIRKLIQKVCPKNSIITNTYFSKAQELYTGMLTTLNTQRSLQSFSYRYENVNGVVTQSSSGAVPPEFQGMISSFTSSRGNTPLQFQSNMESFMRSFKF